MRALTTYLIPLRPFTPPISCLALQQILEVHPPLLEDYWHKCSQFITLLFQLCPLALPCSQACLLSLTPPILPLTCLYILSCLVREWPMVESGVLSKSPSKQLLRCRIHLLRLLGLRWKVTVQVSPL